MEQIKQAFTKVKEDITKLELEIESLKLQLSKITEEVPLIISLIQEISNEIKQQKSDKNTQIQNPTDIPTIQHINPTHNIQIPTQNQNPTHNPTDNLPLKPVKTQYNNTSTGNQGVPTDKPTDKQTDNPTHFPTDKVRFNEEVEDDFHSTKSMEKATEILASLDSIKKEIRLKFKRLTKKELLVFSHVYHLDEEGKEVGYPLIASRMSISESSIRDYINHLIKKGIPITKEKINNKKILLHISPELKKIASLDTILRLREL